MKIKQNSFKIKQSESFQELEYGIKGGDMHLILEILRSKMYSNPIASICREISSNSRDANREGKTKRPIIISFVDNPLFESETCVVFQDEGTGISPNRMADVFVNYGSSTKRNTNTQTGGFGLGAKTPFSYTDSYSIVTRFDGIEYTYLTAIEDGKNGKMFLVDECKTKERNGTQIIVPIKDSDRSQFEKEIYRATGFWEKKPTYQNFERDLNIETLYEHDDCKIVQSGDNQYYNTPISNGYYLLIDGIVYNIDHNSVNIERSYNPNTIVLVGFKTGELTISANRESVQYDKKTIEKIESKFNIFYKHLRTKFNDVIDNNKSYFEASLFAYDFMRNDGKEFGVPYFRNILSLNRDDITYKGNKLASHLDSSFLKYTLVDPSLDGRKRNKPITEINFMFQQYPIYFVDLPRKPISKTRTLNNEHDKYILIEPQNPSIYKFSDMSFGVKKQFARMVRHTLNAIKELNDWEMPMVMYSIVGDTKIKRKPNGSKNKTYRSLNVKVSKCGSLNEYKETILINNESITLDGDVIDEDKCYYKIVSSINDITSQLDDFKIKVAKDVTVIIASQRFEKHFKNRIPHLDTYYDLNKHILIQQIVDREKLDGLIGSRFYNSLKKLKFSDFNIKNTLNNLHNISVAQHGIHLPYSMQDKKIKPSIETQKVMDVIKNIKRKYPLLASLNSYDIFNHVDIDQWNDYITMIDEKETPTKISELSFN